MAYEYKPFTRVDWLMEEHDMTREEAEKKAAEPVCITDIAEVYWTIQGEKFQVPNYCFRTTEDVFVDEAEYSTDEFMLQYFKEDGKYHILCLSDEDFYVGDEVTDQFDVDKILEECAGRDMLLSVTDEPLENRYDEYLEFLEDQEDEDDEDDNSELFMINIDI